MHVVAAILFALWLLRWWFVVAPIFPPTKTKKIDSNYSEKCDKYLAKCVFIARFIGAKGICIEIERL